jgi:hypothetical protein
VAEAGGQRVRPVTVAVIGPVYAVVAGRVHDGMTLAAVVMGESPPPRERAFRCLEPGVVAEAGGQRVRPVTVAVIGPVYAVVAGRVHDGMTLAAVVMGHAVMQGVLDRLVRHAAVADVHAGLVGHAAVMLHVVMQAAAVMTGNAAAVVSGETVVRHTSKATARGCSSLSIAGGSGGAAATLQAVRPEASPSPARQARQRQMLQVTAMPGVRRAPGARANAPTPAISSRWSGWTRWWSPA